jgi:hypothetical protein
MWEMALEEKKRSGGKGCAPPRMSLIVDYIKIILKNDHMVINIFLPDFLKFIISQLSWILLFDLFSIFVISLLLL